MIALKDRLNSCGLMLGTSLENYLLLRAVQSHVGPDCQHTVVSDSKQLNLEPGSRNKKKNNEVKGFATMR